MNVTITLGGLLVGLVLILRQFLPATWGLLKLKAGGKGKSPDPDAAPARFNLREHIPFLLGATVGMLAISCPGGIICTLAAKIVGFSNTAGDKVLAAGAGGTTTSVTRHAAASMTQYGALVTVLLVAAVIILRKLLDKKARGQLGAGVWCGSTLGLSAGAAGLLGSVLIPAVNQLGHMIGGQA
ncbi:hypothetical protein LN042_11465 [Kitasatospora sp. RB6PN24]|uniref:hypothetical protein n=1 Tax=Kitasatospora humi TaxID=2893891 RepID=UPI001E2AC124|nr:hypothetical protein [Kitasatospora humi]MCC9307707.1 hypothetical protein [Kitasatospora humi]